MEVNSSTEIPSSRVYCWQPNHLQKHPFRHFLLRERMLLSLTLVDRDASVKSPHDTFDLISEQSKQNFIARLSLVCHCLALVIVQAPFLPITHIVIPEKRLNRNTKAGSPPGSFQRNYSTELEGMGSGPMLQEFSRSAFQKLTRKRKQWKESSCLRWASLQSVATALSELIASLAC